MSDKDIEILKRDVSKILNYLHNDESTGKKGLVAEVESLKKELNIFVTSYQLQQSYKRGQIVVIAFIGSALFAIGEFLVKIIFK